MSTANLILKFLDIDVERQVFDYLHASGSERKAIVRDARREFRKVSARFGGGKNPYAISPQEIVTKTSHNDVQETWRQGVVYWSAHKSAGIPGLNLCPYATPQCIAGCLGHTSGRLTMNTAQIAQKVRTHMGWEHPAEWTIILLDEARREAEKSHEMGHLFLLRLNGTSDAPWERVPWFLEALRMVGVDQFQDYTKWPKWRRWDATPDDYYLCKSITENDSPDDVEPLDVVVVDLLPHEPMPETWNGMPVIDGDYDHGDLRVMDREKNPDAVVLLRKKGRVLKNVKGDVASFVKPAVVTPVKVGVAS